MKLLQFQLTHENHWDENTPHVGKVDFKLDSGQKMSLELSSAQVEMIAASIAEMVQVQLRQAASRIGREKLEVPSTTNILEG